MKLWLLIFVSVLLMADIVPHDKKYYTKEVRNTKLIYTKDNVKFAGHTAEVEMKLQPQYEDKFGYKMDETLYVGLISDNNQIANGFSTQFPNNRQINYVGGALDIDYFSSTSWLDTLLYHETAHNYQVNAKSNGFSRFLHTVFGNGGLIAPLFTIPNITESSFLLEGNAILNESWHGNGGRLYSGRFKAATLMQAKAGYLTPERVYNDNYFFLYGSHHYTLGSYYQQYIAKKYGLKKVNSYWMNHSWYWFWPFITNLPMRRSIGVDFETSFNAWSEDMSREAALVVEPTGEIIASSQFYTPMNGDENEIYFIINENGRERPELVVYNKKSGETTKEEAGWISGKVVKTENEYATQGSAKTSPWRIHMGLYDDSAFIFDKTEGKVVEGYLGDGSMVYFDIKSSFDQPQLYVGDKFYAQVNSSAYIDGNDLYYFVQKGKIRTLYKNRMPLFSIKGYYSYVSGIDSKGGVYFIANTEHGSGLYRFGEGRFSRASSADTIFDARLIDDEHALVAAMGSDAYLYEKIPLEDINEAPHEVVLFVEKQPYYKAAEPSAEKNDIPKIDLEEPYYSVLAMNYSATTLNLGNDMDAGFIYNIDIRFADPLNQNEFSLFSSRNLDEYTIAGAGYRNSQYFIQYSIQAYGVLDHPNDENTTNLKSEDDKRDFGIAAIATLPFIQMGHYYAALNGSYYQDYESHSREPLSASLKLSRFEQYGVSMYPNSYIDLVPYISKDRDDITFGGSGELQHELGMEFYIGLEGQYSESDAKDNLDERGVKISKAVISIDGDPTRISMPSIRDTTYVKSAVKGGASLKKVINLSSYFFTFPVSLRRESLYASYNYYDLEMFNTNEHEKVDEITAGLTLDTFILNVAPILLSFEYIYNSNDNIADEHNFRFTLGFAF